jgi:hypothetical protein
MGNSPEPGHRAIWRTAEATAADCLTCFTNQSSQFLHALFARLHSRAVSTHKALLPCTLLCALTAALPCPLLHSRARRAPALSCLQHAQGCLALYALLRSYSCTCVPAARTKRSSSVRSLAPSAALTCLLHAQALVPCALPRECLSTLPRLGPQELDERTTPTRRQPRREVQVLRVRPAPLWRLGPGRGVLRSRELPSSRHRC